MSSVSVGQADSAMFAMLFEKIMPLPIKPSLLTYCPTMDLIALVTSDEQVHVNRMNGQRVALVHGRKNCETIFLRWKPDGQRLCTLAREHR